MVRFLQKSFAASNLLGISAGVPSGISSGLLLGIHPMISIRAPSDIFLKTFPGIPPVITPEVFVGIPSGTHTEIPPEILAVFSRIFTGTHQVCIQKFV